MSNIYPGMVNHGTNNKGEKITNDEVTDFRNISKIKNVDHFLMAHALGIVNINYDTMIQG